MEIPVLVKPLPEGGFQARSAEPFGWTAEGDSPDDALRHLRELIQEQTASGVVVTSIEIPTPNRGSYLGGGIYKDDPLYDRWRAAVEEYRQEVEDDPNRL